MTQRDRLKVLIDIPAGDPSKDLLLELLLEQATAYFLSYCRRDFADESMMPLIVRMAAEDYGRSGGEGIAYRTASGASESYRGEYSPQIMTELRRFRRIGVVEC